MKKLVSLILLASLFFVSCKNNETKEAEEAVDETTVTEESTEAVDTDKAKDCDEFIDQYEAWMDNYLVFLEKYLKNPLDAATSEEYMKLSQESLNWMTQWTGNLYFCAAQEKYARRFEEISDKAEAKMKELGLE